MRMDANKENGVEYFLASAQLVRGHRDEQAMWGREPPFMWVERRQP